MSATEAVRIDRVLMSESVMDVYRLLKGDANSEPEQSPFETYKDIFMLAACLGFRAGRRQSLPSGSKHDIRTSVFTEGDMAVLRAIAIANTGDVEVLNREGEVLRIAEEYAHSGIYDVKTYLLDESGQPLWNLVNLINEVASSVKWG